MSYTELVFNGAKLKDLTLYVILWCHIDYLQLPQFSLYYRLLSLQPLKSCLVFPILSNGLSHLIPLSYPTPLTMGTHHEIITKINDNY
jgi:hypothetical protein